MNLYLPELIRDHIVMLVFITSLDLLFGDPNYALHPVRLMGKLIEWFETKLRKIGMDGKIGGTILVLFLSISVLLVCLLIGHILGLFHWILTWFWYIYLGWSFIALRDLLVHSREVAQAIEEDNIVKVRQKVSKIVGRETKRMDIRACGRATVESVSENLNDGVIAPFFYFCIFGIFGMVFYKVLSTLDSMVGYKNEKYKDFGWFAAKMDDCLSWIPARVSWLLLSGTAGLLPGFSGVNALKVGWKDCSKLSSPNAGWCEATAAGALNIKLCGPIWRDGKLSQEFWIGNSSEREGATSVDIYRMNKLVLGSTLLGILLFVFFLYFSRFVTLIGT